jgi:hypothetical protein
VLAGLAEIQREREKSTLVPGPGLLGMFEETTVLRMLARFVGLIQLIWLMTFQPMLGNSTYNKFPE